MSSSEDAALALPDQLHRRLRDDADRVILSLVDAEGNSERITGARLAERSMAFAAALGARAGAQPSVVGICLYHGLDLHAAFVGSLWAGHVPTMIAPPSPRMEPARYADGFRGILEHVRPASVVLDQTTRDKLAGRDLDLFSDTTAIDAGAVDEGGEVPLQSRPLDDVVLLQHSSGTTGLQKGVALTSHHVRRHNAAYTATLGIGRDDIIASWLPLYHDMGFIACFVLPLLEGIPTVQMSAFDWVRRPMMLLEEIHRQRATLCWLPNFAFSFLAEQYKPERVPDDLDLSCVRAWVNSSEPVAASSMREFAAAFAKHGVSREQLTASYAMAENVYAVTQSLPGELRTLRVDAQAFSEHRVQLVEESAEEFAPGTREFVSNGAAVRGTELQIRSLEDGARLPDDFAGEIVLRGDYVFDGYYERDDLSELATTDDGWYRSGDVGFLHEGELYVTGRLKDLIIIQGRNFYPNDFEATAGAVDGVASGRSVAFGVPDPRSGTERLVILVEPEVEPGDPRIALGVRKAIAQAFDCTAGDVRVVPPRWLVKSSSGKLARAANRDKYLAQLAPGDR